MKTEKLVHFWVFMLFLAFISAIFLFLVVDGRDAYKYDISIAKNASCKIVGRPAIRDSEHMVIDANCYYNNKNIVAKLDNFKLIMNLLQSHKTNMTCEIFADKHLANCKI